MYQIIEAPPKYLLRITGRGQTPVIVGTSASAAVRVTLALRGAKGDKPAHTWSGTALVFQNPDGSMGEAVDLKGDKGDAGGLTTAELDSISQLATEFDPVATFNEALK